MAWKIEKWLSDVFPGKDEIYSKYRLLPRRELAIVAASSLDLALAELISKRLIEAPKECEEFLGANEDGRAPAGSFGARIQLAYLLGIITAEDSAKLKIIKNIRNKFAHRMSVDFTSETVKPLIKSLYDKVIIRTQPEFDMKPYFDMTPEAGAGLLLSVFCIYQAYFHLLSGIIPRLTIVSTPSVSVTLSLNTPAGNDPADGSQS